MATYYIANDKGIVTNVVVFDSTDPVIEFDGNMYYLNDRNLSVGDHVNYTYYEQVKIALDGRLADSDFWELPSVQQEVLNGAELVAYRKQVRALRLNLTRDNYMEIYDAIPEKPTEQWNRQEV